METNNWFAQSESYNNIVTKQNIYEQVAVAVWGPEVTHNNPQTDRHTDKESE